jgi:hypothetical protein
VHTKQNASFGDHQTDNFVGFIEVDRRTFGEDTAYAPFKFCG